jgi:hypothetical protein
MGKAHTQYLVSQAIRKARKAGIPQEQALAMAMKLKRELLDSQRALTKTTKSAIE